MASRIGSRRYGTVSIDRQKEMSGLEFVQGLATSEYARAPFYGRNNQHGQVLSVHYRSRPPPSE